MANTHKVHWKVRRHQLQPLSIGLSADSFSLVDSLMVSTSGNQWLGLHVTSDELAIWQDRAVNGPYKTAGDESTNSPGDWTRITTNKNNFSSNPSLGRAAAPVTTNGCVEANVDTYGWPEPGGATPWWSHRLRDAAFYDLVMGETTNQAAIKTELLWISSQTFTDWGDPNGIWCFNSWHPGDSAPTFGITSWLTRILFAYDYVGRGAFTQAELDQLDRWFFDAADYWRTGADASLNSIFVDRWGGNYTLTDANSCTYNPQIPFVGGDAIADIPAKFYNNRRGGMLRFTALAGVYLQAHGRSYTDGRTGTLDQVLESGKMYAREYVRFSVFPQGYVGDFERVTDGVDVGWAYSASALAQVLAIADAFARIGDDSLYTYNTALGACNTVGTINDGGARQGENRDLLFAVQSFLSYSTDVYARYYPSNDSPTDNNRIDGRNPRVNPSWSDVRDTSVCLSNLYFNDDFIKQAYTRTHSGCVPYPASPASSGTPPYTGEMGIFPAMLFMFGQMEGTVNPYP